MSAAVDSGSENWVSTADGWALEEAFEAGAVTEYAGHIRTLYALDGRKRRTRSWIDREAISGRRVDRDSLPQEFLRQFVNSPDVVSSGALGVVEVPGPEILDGAPDNGYAFEDEFRTELQEHFANSPIRHVSRLRLAAAAMAVPLESLDAFELVELLADVERLSAWIHARKLAVVRELAEEIEGVTHLHMAGPRGSARDVVANEIQCRLGTSRRVATRLVSDAVDGAERLHDTYRSLMVGAVSVAQANVIFELLTDAPSDVALYVEELILRDAAGKSPAELRREIQLALAAADPELAEERMGNARAGRKVCRPRSLGDGMASMFLVLPAPSATLLDDTLDAFAKAARAGGEDRTTDQLRADVMIDLVEELAACASGEETWLTMSRMSASAAQPTAKATKRRKAPGKHVQIFVTVGLSTLVGLDDLPGDLDGYGPIPADQARALAAGGTWSRIVTDPLSGAVLDVGRTKYQPPADLARYIRHRDVTCSRPGCTVKARHCEGDHDDDWATGGDTSAQNINSLCSADHTVKTMGGARLHRDADGNLLWSTITGHTYRAQPDPVRWRQLALAANEIDPWELGEPPF